MTSQNEPYETLIYLDCYLLNPVKFRSAYPIYIFCKRETHTKVLTWVGKLNYNCLKMVRRSSRLTMIKWKNIRLKTTYWDEDLRNV